LGYKKCGGLTFRYEAPKKKLVTKEEEKQGSNLQDGEKIPNGDLTRKNLLRETPKCKKGGGMFEWTLKPTGNGAIGLQGRGKRKKKAIRTKKKNT